jgi:hypothetical protein
MRVGSSGAAIGGALAPGPSPAQRARGVRRALALSLASLALCVSVQAQQGGHHRRKDPAAADAPDADAPMRHSLIEEFSAHLADVQQRLKLEPRQLAAWDLYSQRVQALMQDLLRGTAPLPENEPAPRQIDRRVDVVRNRLAAMEDIADAARALYAQLDEGQRKRADEILPTTLPTLYSGLPQSGRAGPEHKVGSGAGSRDKGER